MKIINTRKPCCYFIQHEEMGPIKIGFTTNFRARIDTINAYSSNKAFIIKIVYGGNKNIEKMLLRKFKDTKLKQRGEWFENTKEIRDLIAILPRDSSPIELEKIIKAYKFETVTKTEDPFFFLKERLKEVNSRLDRGIVNSKNSGFTQGINFAKTIIEELLLTK